MKLPISTKLRFFHLCVALLLGAALLSFPFSTFAATGISHQVSFQGKVTNTDGTNVTNGSYSFTFSLYNVSSAGTATWTETKSLTVTDGIFQTNLGSVTTLPGSVDFNTDTWYLGINFNGDGEMSPRIQFTAVPQAFNAEKVSGLTVTSSTGSLTIPNAKAVTFGDAFTTSGAFPLTLTATATTNATIPAGTVTLADTASAQTLTNKTLTSPTLQGTVSAGTGLTLPAFTLAGTITGSGAVTLQSASATSLILDSGTTGSISIGTSASAKAITIGNSTAGTSITLVSGVNSTTNNIGIVIGTGASNSDTAQTNLVFDNSSTFTETASTCSTTGPINSGAMYFNSTTQAFRACINGSWEDLVSTAGSGINLFGVIADSGSASEQGDLNSTVTNAAGSPLSGPCKVSWASATTVTWRSCTAYSGGRKVLVTAPGSPLAITGTASVPWQHLCLTGTNNQPAFTTAAASEAANLPTFSINNPILCLATVKNNGAATPNISNIYDTRTFTNTRKTFAVINAAVAPGWIVKQSATANQLGTTTTASDTNLAGVVVASSSSASSTGVNVIIANGGPAFVSSTGTSTATQMVVTTTTAGYAGTTTTAPGVYGSLGIAQRTIDTLCNATNVCQFSQLLDIKPR